ncbi:MAG TPA: aromatic ring-hydroxylating dioxygenase subunit alpha [Ktedonobacteraceae bacterium]
MTDTREDTFLSAGIQQLIASYREGYALPRAFYCDTALYTHELERIWRQDWLFAGHTCELPRPGDFFTFTLDTDPVLVIRADEQHICAFHNVCTHRGTLLCEEERGHVRALVCPYHQWTFARNGSLLSCVGMQEGIDKTRLGLRPLPIETCEGLIFVSFAQTPPPFGEAGEVLAHQAHMQGLVHAKVAKVIDYEVAANWKLVWENNRECYHCNVNHPQYIKSNFDIYEDEQSSPIMQQRLEEALARSKAAWQDEGLEIMHQHGGLAAFPDAGRNIWYSATRTVLREGYESESMDGRRVAPLMGAYRNAHRGVLRLRTLPNFWNHSSCDLAVSTRLLPAGLNRTKVRVTWLVAEDAREEIDYHPDELITFWQLTSEQDWELCEREQRGVRSTGYRPGPLSHTREYNLEAFLRWYVRQLSS